MNYTLEAFCADSRAILKAHPLDDALAQIADKLSRLLIEPTLVSATFNDDMLPGKTTLQPACWTRTVSDHRLP